MIALSKYSADLLGYICDSFILFCLLSVCLSVRLSVCLSTRPSVCYTVCPSVRLSVCPSVRLSVYLSVRPFVCLSVCPFVCLSVCPTVCQSLCLSAFCLPVYMSSFSLSWSIDLSIILVCLQLVLSLSEKKTPWTIFTELVKNFFRLPFCLSVFLLVLSGSVCKCQSARLFVMSMHGCRLVHLSFVCSINPRIRT